jgi:hypothetical protein
MSSLGQRKNTEEDSEDSDDIEHQVAHLNIGNGLNS